VQQPSELLQDWRRSAQQVTRAWNAWLAAEHRDRSDRYLSYVSALAEEERTAAEVQRLIQPYLGVAAGLGEGSKALGALAVLATNVVLMVAAAAITLSLQRRIARSRNPP
jgi:hypothetical protein